MRELLITFVAGMLGGAIVGWVAFWLGYKRGVQSMRREAQLMLKAAGRLPPGSVIVNKIAPGSVIVNKIAPGSVLTPPSEK